MAAKSPSSGPTPKGSRVLSIDVNIGKNGDFTKAFNEARYAGLDAVVLPLNWDQIETAPNAFAPDPNYLAMANAYYPALGIPVHLVLRPIHTNQKVVPAELMDLEFDDPRTIARFERTLDWVASQIPSVNLKSLVIGSEVDVFLWGDPIKWSAWTKFYSTVAAYARRRFPGTLISCETTHAAFSGPDLERVRTLHRWSDIIGVSYYPMSNQLRAVQSPSVVNQDFATIVHAIPKKPIIYYQIGYPSSRTLGSSPKQQAAFVTATFRAWDEHANRILMLDFQWMHEIQKLGVDAYVDYYDNDTRQFREFLGSLGFQSWSGKPKPAWYVFQKEATARGFGYRAR